MQGNNCVKQYIHKIWHFFHINILRLQQFLQIWPVQILPILPQKSQKRSPHQSQVWIRHRVPRRGWIREKGCLAEHLSFKLRKETWSLLLNDGVWTQAAVKRSVLMGNLRWISSNKKNHAWKLVLLVGYAITMLFVVLYLPWLVDVPCFELFNVCCVFCLLWICHDWSSYVCICSELLTLAQLMELHGWHPYKHWCSLCYAQHSILVYDKTKLSKLREVRLECREQAAPAMSLSSIKLKHGMHVS